MGISIFSKIHPRHTVTYKTPRRIGIIFHIEEFTTLKIPYQTTGIVARLNNHNCSANSYLTIFTINNLGE